MKLTSLAVLAFSLFCALPLYADPQRDLALNLIGRLKSNDFIVPLHYEGLLLIGSEYDDLRDLLRNEALRYLTKKEKIRRTSLEPAIIYLQIGPSTPAFEDALGFLIQIPTQQRPRLIDLVEDHHLTAPSIINSLLYLIEEANARIAVRAMNAILELEKIDPTKVNDAIAAYKNRTAVLERLQRLHSEHTELSRSQSLGQAEKSKRIVATTKTFLEILIPKANISVDELIAKIQEILRTDLVLPDEFVRSNLDFCRQLVASFRLQPPK